MHPTNRTRPRGSRFACVVWLSLAASCLPTQRADDEHALEEPRASEVDLERELAPRTARDADHGDDAAAVLVVLDGARWQEVFVGADPALAASAHVAASSAGALMPHLHALEADRGAALGAPGHGAPIAASGPNFVSLPGYTEIFSGRRRHACDGNECDPTRTPTLADEVRAASSGPADVAVFASWDRIERAASAAPSDIVLSTGRSSRSRENLLREDPVSRDWLDRGAHADPFPGSDDFRPDRFTAALAIRYLETRRPRFLFLGLGEPDEYAHRGDYAGYLASLHAADDAIGALFAALGRMGTRGEHTAVFVTADHGRARDYRFHGREFPESARVWLVALGGGVQARGLAQSRRPHRLADIAPTVRVLLDLPPDVDPAAGTPLEELLTPRPERSAMRP